MLLNDLDALQKRDIRRVDDFGVPATFKYCYTDRQKIANGQ